MIHIGAVESLVETTNIDFDSIFIFQIENSLDIDMCDWELLDGYLPSVISRNIFLWCVFVICKTGPQFQLYNYAIKT